MIVSQPRRLQMIEQALKYKAPKMYRELKAAKKLQSFLADQEEAMMESYYEAYSAARSKILLPTNQQSQLEKEQSLFMAQREAWEDAMATWMEFADMSADEQG